MDARALGLWLALMRATGAAFPSAAAIVRAGVAAGWGTDPFPDQALEAWLTAVVAWAREVPPGLPLQPGDVVALGDQLPAHLVVRDPVSGALQVTVHRIGNQVGTQPLPPDVRAYRLIPQSGIGVPPAEGVDP